MYDPVFSIDAAHPAITIGFEYGADHSDSVLYRPSQRDRCAGG
jgi:hypothetical protein